MMGAMLDHRVYRAAFVPAVFALFLVAFSLADRPAPVTTRTAPDAFDLARSFSGPAGTGSLRDIEDSFPDRRAGGPGDAGVADRVATVVEEVGFGVPERRTITATTPDGQVELPIVTVERQGLSRRRILVLAHREDASATAALLEIARVFADRDVQRTLVLASVSGATAGYAAARDVAESMAGDVEAAVVLGDLASVRPRRPFVVPWAVSGRPAPHGLRRSVEAALRVEIAADPGGPRASSQWARRVVPVTVSGQGVVNASDVPAVLVSVTGELGPRPGARPSDDRFEVMGRGVLRAVFALDEAGLRGGQALPDAEPSSSEALPFATEPQGVVTVGRLLPDWAVRVLVGTLLLPVLLAALDAFARVRRRRVAVLPWFAWVGAWALPFLLTWAWLRGLDLAGAVRALEAPAPPGSAPMSGGPLIAMISAAAVLVAGHGLLRPLIVRAAGLRGDPAAGGGPAALVTVLAGLAFGVWLLNPYAAGVLLPAAHVWLLAAAGGGWDRLRPRRAIALAAVGAGLLLPLAVALYVVRSLSLDAAETLRLLFDLVAGGEVGALDALAISLLAGVACGLAQVLRRRRRAADLAPEETIVTRGPGGYAGPGSLGGTESALRR